MLNQKCSLDLKNINYYVICAAVVMVYHTTSCTFCLSSVMSATVMQQDCHLSQPSHKCYLNTSGLTTLKHFSGWASALRHTAQVVKNESEVKHCRVSGSVNTKSDENCNYGGQ